MLNLSDLTTLYRSLQNQQVLSIYLDADQTDPAARNAWRTLLDQEIGARAQEVNGDDRGAFDAAWGQVREALRDLDGGFFEGRGLVVFATPEKIHYLEHLPISTRTLVRWEEGIRAAPYLRALKQQRPIHIVVADRMRVRHFTYRETEMVEEPGMVADQALGDLSDANVSKRSSRSSGVRGETSTDLAKRILDENSERMFKSVGRMLDEEAGKDDLVVVGGTLEAASRLVDFLPDRLRDRARKETSLHLEMTPNQIREKIRELASALTAREQEELVTGVLDAARSQGRGSAGREDTEKALREMRVDTLLVARDFLWEDPDYADRCVGTAFSQGADVEELGGEAGRRLMEESGGIAARLRYRP